MLHTTWTRTHANVSASLLFATQVKSSTTRAVAVGVKNTSPVPITNTSMKHHANASAVASRNAALDNTMTMSLVNVYAEIHQHVTIRTRMTHIRVSVSASHTSVHLISTLTRIHAAAGVPSTRVVPATNTSTTHHVSVNAVISKSVVHNNTTIMTLVSVSVAIFQLVLLHTTLILPPAIVPADPKFATRISTLTMTPAAVSAMNI